MNHLEKNKIIKLFVTSTVQCFFAGYGKIKNSKNIDGINNSIDKLLAKNFPILSNILHYENQDKLLEEYTIVLNTLKNNWKKRYVELEIV